MTQIREPSAVLPYLTPPPSSNNGKWLVLLAAFLGWMFDGLEMGLFPLAGRPALKELMHAAGPDADKNPKAAGPRKAPP